MIGWWCIEVGMVAISSDFVMWDDCIVGYVSQVSLSFITGWFKKIAIMIENNETNTLYWAQIDSRHKARVWYGINTMH